MIISIVVALMYILLILISCHKLGENSLRGLIEKDSSKCLKELTALLGVLSHDHYYAPDLGLLKIFKPFGYVGVSIFSFIQVKV